MLPRKCNVVHIAQRIDRPYRKLLASVGIKRKLVPHDLHRTVAAGMLELTQVIRDVQAHAWTPQPAINPLVSRPRPPPGQTLTRRTPQAPYMGQKGNRVRPSAPQLRASRRASPLEVFDGRDGSQLLYAAQIALSILKQKGEHQPQDRVSTLTGCSVRAISYRLPEARRALARTLDRLDLL